MDEKKFIIRPRIGITLTREDIDDIMVTALEGGICHWCGKAEPSGNYLGRYASEQIGRGGTLVLHDAESSDKWELTLEKFLDGARLYFEKSSGIHVENGRIDTSDIDADAADSIVQLALFGDLMFG